MAQKPAFAARVRQRGRSWAGAKVSLLAPPGSAWRRRIEQSEGVVKGNFATVLKIQNALEQARIHFTDDEAGEIGVKR